MMSLRLARVLLHLFAGLATCALIFPLLDESGRQLRVKRWSARLLKLCGVNLEVRRERGSVPDGPALVVSNHVSWLDIFVINALHPCYFVAKSDIRDWPLIGWLCERAGTIFIARGRLRDVRRIYQGLVESLQSGQQVAFFPEGTTASQGSLLPFHANLFEAAIEARVPIQPFALTYVDHDGKPAVAVDFVGDMTFAASMFAILSAPGITARLSALPSIPAGHASHRRELADAARHAIAGSLHAEI